uniref:HDC11104 n=1 Tax=Drosophila melanogaster TaxID=7227 RepID=Q6IKX9_DROME|nr:TPA_inf: HDC11104 [Drosophila melanogaster]
MSLYEDVGNDCVPLMAQSITHCRNDRPIVWPASQPYTAFWRRFIKRAENDACSGSFGHAPLHRTFVVILYCLSGSVAIWRYAADVAMAMWQWATGNGSSEMRHSSPVSVSRQTFSPQPGRTKRRKSA